MKTILAVLISLAVFLPNISFAVIDLNLDYPCFSTANPNNCPCEVGEEKCFDLDTTQNLNQIIAWFYYLIIGISGLAAFVMIVAGGFKYLTSAGSPSAIGDAKDQIKSALLGLLLILVSYLILQVINPDLILLQEPLLR